MAWWLLSLATLAAGFAALSAPSPTDGGGLKPDAVFSVGLCILGYACATILPRIGAVNAVQVALGVAIAAAGGALGALALAPGALALALVALGASLFAAGWPSCEGRARGVLPSLVLLVVSIVMLTKPTESAPLAQPWLAFTGDVPTRIELALLLASWAGVARSWHYSPKSGGSAPPWLGVLAGLVAAAFAFSGWMFLLHAESASLRDARAQRERSIRDLLKTAVEADEGAMARAAHGWNGKLDGASSALSEEFAQLFAHVPGLAGVVVTDSDGHVIASQLSSNALPLTDVSLRALIAAAGNGLEMLRTLSSPGSSESHTLVVVPIQLDELATRRGGFIFDVLSSPYLEARVGQYLDHYQIELFDAGLLVFEHGGAPGPSIDAPPVSAGVRGTTWQLRAEPLPGSGLAGDALPEALLAAGLLSALLVGTTTYFAQSSSRRAGIAQTAHSQLEALLDATDRVAIIATDLSGDITVFNAGAESLTGASAEIVVGEQTPLFMLSPTDREALELDHPNLAFRGLIAALRGDRMHRRAWTIRRPDGSERQASVAASAWSSSDGTPLGYLVVAVDVTEQVAALDEATHAREQAEEANAAKSQFLANVSHEIRTPMSAILGYADMLLDPVLPTAEKDECVRVIKRNGQHLLGIINDILDISKIEAGRMAIERTEVRPAQLVDDVVALIRPRAQAKGIELNTSLAPSAAAVVVTDPLRVRQILMNLAANAVKFTEQGEVAIQVEVEQSAGVSRLRISVRDTGIGMDGPQIQRLFHNFTQGDASTSRRFGGTGLGLAISRKLVELLEGTITVESALGTGSAFTVLIPVGTPWSQPAVQSLAGCRVLLAEDGPDNARLIASLLRRSGALVTVVGDGSGAIHAVKRDGADNFDLVLMDLQMPGVDGYEACTRLRALGFRAPIIALTGNAFDGDRDRCLRSGFDHYAVKPIPREQLIALCESAVRRDASPPRPA